MSASAKISPVQRIAALKALGGYDPFHGTLGNKTPGMRYGQDDEYQYGFCLTAGFRWHMGSFASPVDYYEVPHMSDLALSSVKAMFAKCDKDSDRDFPMSIGDFKRAHATGPLKECSPSEIFTLDNKGFNPRLLSRVLYCICSRENCIPLYRSHGNAVQPIYLRGDLGEAVLCPLRPLE